MNANKTERNNDQEEQRVPYVVPEVQQRDSKQGKTRCANVCYHTIDFQLETISAEDIKFDIKLESYTWNREQ